MNSPQRHRAFTIIELLTVIAIVGILAALITGAVGNVRQTANRSAAASQMRSGGGGPGGGGPGGGGPP